MSAMKQQCGCPCLMSGCFSYFCCRAVEALTVRTRQILGFAVDREMGGAGTLFELCFSR